MKGKLIVIEGTDASGKATQAEMLQKHFSELYPGQTEKVSFPNYKSNSSMLVRMYLAGAFGTDPDSVNPYAASSFYAVDRYADYKSMPWGRLYDEGGIIVADRYTTSNATHQAEKVTHSERGKFLDWLFDHEYHKMGIPEPDLVVFLDMPTEIAVQLMKARREADATHVTDIHEKDEAYLARCRECGLDVANAYDWKIVQCNDGDKPKSVDAIQDEIRDLVKAHVSL